MRTIKEMIMEARTPDVSKYLARLGKDWRKVTTKIKGNQLVIETPRDERFDLPLSEKDVKVLVAAGVSKIYSKDEVKIVLPIESEITDIQIPEEFSNLTIIGRPNGKNEISGWNIDTGAFHVEKAGDLVISNTNINLHYNPGSSELFSIYLEEVTGVDLGSTKFSGTPANVYIETAPWPVFIQSKFKDRLVQAGVDENILNRKEKMDDWDFDEQIIPSIPRRKILGTSGINSVKIQIPAGYLPRRAFRRYLRFGPGNSAETWVD